MLIHKGLPLHLLHLLLATSLHLPPEVEGVGEGGGVHQVGSLVSSIVEEYMEKCYLVLVGVELGDPLFQWILSSLMLKNEAGVVLDLKSAYLSNNSALLQDLKEGDDKFSCRTFIVVGSSSGNDDHISKQLDFLEDVNLFLWPYTRVIFVGPDKKAHDMLKGDALRNTIDALYLGLDVGRGEITKESSLDDNGNIFKRVVEGKDKDDSEEREKNNYVKCYHRCLYCNSGHIGVVFLDQWSPDKGFAKKENLFPDQFRDLRGHRFRIVTLDWFPIMDFVRNSKESMTTVTPLDSIDVRMLNTFASVLNFTFEMRVPWDNQWGTSTPSGNWTGVVGTLQHHKADFSMVLSWMWGRRQVVDYSRIYASEPIIMITLKPGPLPQSLALARPLTGEIWAAVFFSTVLGGFVLYLLQRTWAKFYKGARGLSLSNSVIYTWSILFEEPPPRIPTNMSGQMFIGWWWLYCTLLTAMYKGSLIAHLSVPSASPTIDSFSQLLRQPGWTWGYEPSYGAGWEWFKLNDNPVIKKIFQGMEVMEFEDQMERVLKGRHALITWKYKIRSLIATFYTDEFGYTPIYTGKQDYFNYGGYGWAFRKGAPFRRAIDLQKQRLIETGFIGHWRNELIGSAARKARQETDKEQEKGRQKRVFARQETSGGRVVLSLHHLQGVFYILALGFSGAFLALIGENLVSCFVTRVEKKVY